MFIKLGDAIILSCEPAVCVEPLDVALVEDMFIKLGDVVLSVGENKTMVAHHLLFGEFTVTCLYINKSSKEKLILFLVLYFICN